MVLSVPVFLLEALSLAKEEVSATGSNVPAVAPTGAASPQDL